MSKESAVGNQEGVQDAVCNALFVGVLFSIVGSAFMLGYTDKALSSVLKSEFGAGKQPCRNVNLSWMLD